MDLLLFVATPMLIVPLVFLLRSPWVGVEVETVSLIVAAFGGLGHHLPGMIRAYGDRDLFHRFRMRFILAPILLLLVCVPLSMYRFNAMLLVLAVWAYWHALMQVYGFVRIYDVKVGSVSPATARWDWLMCVTWFAAGMVFSNGKITSLLGYWYDSGGPLIPPGYVHAFRWMCLAAAVATLVGFLINYAIQWNRGQRPNPVKLLMLSSGIGFWWLAMVFVENIVLGIALFEIFHDVQYLTIVWLYNCRRVNANAELGSFMKFLFRRSHAMLLLYVGLVFAYGLLGLSVKLPSETLKRFLLGFLWTSNILHFYYDGFIWKVRESSTRAGLGLNEGQNAGGSRRFSWGEWGHALKWAPLIAVIGWLSISELRGSTLPQNAKEKRKWPETTEVERARNIAAAVPGDFTAQKKAATALQNAGRTDEAIALLKSFTLQHPTNGEAQEFLGGIYHLTGELEQAASCYRTAIRIAEKSKSPYDLMLAHHRLGEVYWLQNNVQAAEAQFHEALKIDPHFEGSLKSLEFMRKNGGTEAPIR